MRYHKIIFILAALFCSGAALAAELTWDDALARARQVNPTLIKAAQAVQSAKLGANRSLGAFLPNLSASAGISQSQSEQLPVSKQASAGLNGSLSLFNGFADLAAKEQADADKQIALQRYQRSLSDVTYHLKRDYITLLWAQDQVALFRQIQEKRDENMKLIQLKYDAGIEDKGSLLQVKADKAQADYDLNRAERARALALVNLNRSIGLDKPVEFIAVSSFAIPSGAAAVEIEKVLPRTPEYIQEVFTLNKAAAQRATARSGLYPSLNLNGSLNRSGDTWFPASSGWSAGLSLSYPFFTGGRNFYDAAIGALAYETAQETFRENVQLLRSSIADGLNSFIDSVEGVSVAKKSAEASKIQSDISTEKYLNGLVAYFEWYSVVNGYINSQKSLLNTRRDALLQQAAWQNLLGEPAQ